MVQATTVSHQHHCNSPLTSSLVPLQAFLNTQNRVISVSIFLSLLCSKLSKGLLSHPDETLRSAQWPTRPYSIRFHPYGSPPSLHSSHTGVLTVHKHAGTLLPASGPLHWLFLGFTYSPCSANENKSFPAGLPRLLHLNCNRPLQNFLTPVLLCLP